MKKMTKVGLLLVLLSVASACSSTSKKEEVAANDEVISASQELEQSDISSDDLASDANLGANTSGLGH